MPSAAASFTDDERRRVNDAVVEAERATSAEIMAVVASASGRYDRAEDMAGLFLGLAALSIAWFGFQRQWVEWDEPAMRLGLIWVLLIVIGGFIAGAFIAANVGWVRRLFTFRSEMNAEVNVRARQVFFDYRVRRTVQRGGVLLYVSLFERTAVVLADDVATEKLGEGAVQALCTQLTERLHGGSNVADAICETIRAAGEKLAAVLPRQPGDVNELPDVLVTID
jgi:putative membrane protein